MLALLRCRRAGAVDDVDGGAYHAYGYRDAEMARNPLLNERRRARKSERPRIPIVGGERPDRRHMHLPAFSTHDEYLASEKDVVAVIHAHPHPLDILVDGSIFAPSRVDLVRHLLASTEIRLILHVALELVDLFNMTDERTEELRDVLFPRGSISALLRQDGMRVLPGHRRVAAKLAELLHLRRRALQGPFEQFRAQHGREERSPWKWVRRIKAGESHKNTDSADEVLR